MLKKPIFEDAWSAFARINLPLAQVGEIMGGEVKTNIDMGFFQNGCTLRLSYVLNACGAKIQRRPGVSTVSGRDGSWNLFRVKDAIATLRREWGEPDVVLHGPPIDSRPLLERKGVLAFEVPFSDATGHFTLWNGQTFSDHGYFDRATRCYLWELPTVPHDREDQPLDHMAAV